jgi:predicted phage baseplate assembly protein
LEFTSNTEVRILNRFLIEAAYPEIVKHRMIVQTQGEDCEWENWYEVDDFESSCPEDTHFIFDPDKNEIMFGNGLNGRMPLKSEKIRAAYKTTFGQKGNISKGQKWTGEKTNKIQGTNKKEASGGDDAETIEHAKARAKKDCRTIYRAITSQDFEFLAIHTPGLRVSRAKALPNYSPDYPCIKMPDAVTVVVVPHSRGGDEKIPGDGFRQTVLQHMDMHRLVTSDVYVVFPEYVIISVSCKVHVKKGSSPEKVKEGVLKELKKFLDEGPTGKGWDFGRPVYPSEIYQIIDKTEGVDYAINVSLDCDEPYKKGSIIKIPPISLVSSGEHRIEIV